MDELIKQAVQNPWIQAVLLGILPAFLVDLRTFLTWNADVGGGQKYDFLTAGFRWLQGAVLGLLGYFGTWIGLYDSFVVQSAITGALSGIAVDIDRFRKLGGFQDAAQFAVKPMLIRAAQGLVVGLLTGYGISIPTGAVPV